MVGSGRAARRAPGSGAPGTLPVLRVSRAVADRRAADGSALHGTVHSAFARAANLRLRDGTFVSLAGRELPLPPNGAAVSLPTEDGFPALGLTPGQPFALDGDGLWFPLLLLRFDWRTAPRWEPRPGILPGVRERVLAERLARLRALVLTEAPPGGLVPLLGHIAVTADSPALDALGLVALPAAHLLVQAAVAREIDGAVTASARLAGLGPGLTPAGDDLLAGFLATWILGGAALRLDLSEMRRLTAAMLAAAMPRASELGRGWLPHAARGEVGEAQGALLAALLDRGPRSDEPPPTLPARARAVLAHGATSGGDWLTGVVLGGRAVLRWNERYGWAPESAPSGDPVN